MTVPCALVLSIMLGPLYVHFVQHWTAAAIRIWQCEAHCAHSHLIRAHLCQYFLLKHTIHYVHCPDTIRTIRTIRIISTISIIRVIRIIRIIRAHCAHSHLIRTHLLLLKHTDTSRTRTAFQLLYSNAHCAKLMSEICAHCR